MITPLQLKKVFPACHDPNAWCRVFTMELPTFEITTQARIAAWVAQCGYESGSFNKLRESGSYTAVRLMAVWPKRFPTLASAKPYEYNPEGLLNMIYANELGNGPEGSRDGLLYRGGGLIQLTGRANYREIGKALGLPLESLPKMILQPNIAARTSCYFWKLHDLNAAADQEDFAYITKKINGALEGEAARLGYYTAAKALLNEPAVARGFLPGAAADQVKVLTTPGPRPGSVPPGTIDGVMNPLAG